MAETFKQDRSKLDNHPGMVFIIHLLMDKMCDMPDKAYMHRIMEKHLGKTECFNYDVTGAGFTPKKYLVSDESGEKQMSPQLLITNCFEINKPVMDAFDESQLWDCPDGKEILNLCKYQVVATDMMAAGLSAKERADMLVNYIEALVEVFPECRAVVFENSKKMFTREDIVSCNIPKESKFIHYAVNVRFFNIEGTNDKIVDTIGMSTLFLPDLQYHFHDVNPNEVVNHAYNLLSYIFDEDNPIENGDTIDGLLNGKMSQEIQWTVQYEDSLIQPVRTVIDINMGEYASGNR